MRKLRVSVAVIATALSAGPTFAQDTINKGNPSTTPGRGAGEFGAGAPAAGPRENQSAVDSTPGRSAAPGPTVGTSGGQMANPPSPGNR